MIILLTIHLKTQIEQNRIKGGIRLPLAETF